MKILYVGSSNHYQDDKAHLELFARLPSLIGHQVITSFAPRENATEISMLCKQHGVDGVITSQQSLLAATLRMQVDYLPPPGRKQISLDDYAGSWLDLPSGGPPLIVVNPLERLHSIAYEKFVLDRYVSKLTRPQRWHPQTKFLWKQVHEHTVDAALADIEQSDLVAIDIETLPDDPYRHIDLVGYACYNHANPSESVCYVVHFNSEWAWRFVQKANRSKPAKIFQRGIYDNMYFARWNCPVNNWLWDTLNLMHCWYSELPKRLDFLAGFSLRKQRFWKDDGKSGSMEDKMRYNALDVWGTLNSFLSMMAEIPSYVVDNYIQEFPMNFPALNASLEGVKVNRDKFADVRKQKDAEAEATLSRLRYLISDDNFNPRSPVQMKKLFALLGVGSLPTTGKADMLKARFASPLNEMILGIAVKYKDHATIISNYLDEDKLWNDRWYYDLDPAGTDTGRLASKSSAFWCGDSIQKIPRGDAIKQFLEADDGWELAEPDKAQAEARCVGYLAGEQKLIDLVEGPHDYHSWNAAEFFGIPYEEIYDEEAGEELNTPVRDLSKRTNHGANYNMGDTVMLATMGPKAVSFAKGVLKLPIKMKLKEVCAFMLNAYAKTYPNIKGIYYDKIISTIEVTSKLVSPLGWTRYFFGKPSKRNKPALNVAVAHPSQNLNVAIINKEWYQIWLATLYGELRGLVRIKAQIHDSLLFQYKIGFDPKIVLRYMQTAVEITGADGKTRTMKIPSDIKFGAKAWSNIKKAKKVKV